MQLGFRFLFFPDYFVDGGTYMILLETNPHHYHESHTGFIQDYSHSSTSNKLWNQNQDKMPLNQVQLKLKLIQKEFEKKIERQGSQNINKCLKKIK